MACELAIDLAIVRDLARMRLITFLNHCHHFPGFVYEKARLCPERGIIEMTCDRAAAQSRRVGLS